MNAEQLRVILYGNHNFVLGAFFRLFPSTPWPGYRPRRRSAAWEFRRR